jgi:Fe2+ transport system protein FeoA
MSPNLIQPNVACRIRAVDETTGARLTQMGILPGVELQIVRTSPFGGGTVEVVIGGGDVVALRSDEIVSMECDVVAMPLSSPAIEPGRYRIVALAGRSGFQHRMAAQGIVTGTVIEVITTSPLVVSANGQSTNTGRRHHRGRGGHVGHGASLRLGRGEADKVVVEETDDVRP